MIENEQEVMPVLTGTSGLAYAAHAAKPFLVFSKVLSEQEMEEAVSHASPYAFTHLRAAIKHVDEGVDLESLKSLARGRGLSCLVELEEQHRVTKYGSTFAVFNLLSAAAIALRQIKLRGRDVLLTSHLWSQRQLMDAVFAVDSGVSYHKFSLRDFTGVEENRIAVSVGELLRAWPSRFTIIDQMDVERDVAWATAHKMAEREKYDTLIMAYEDTRPAVIELYRRPRVDGLTIKTWTA